MSTAYSSIKRLAEELIFIKRQSKNYLTLIWVGFLGVRFVLAGWVKSLLLSKKTNSSPPPPQSPLRLGLTKHKLKVYVTKHLSKVHLSKYIKYCRWKNFSFVWTSPISNNGLRTSEHIPSLMASDLNGHYETCQWSSI